MHHLTVWGTQVQLQAAASLASHIKSVHLLRFKKQLISTAGSVTNLGTLKVELPRNRATPTNLDLELPHLRGCHFNCILHWEEDFCSTEIEYSSSWMDVT